VRDYSVLVLTTEEPRKLAVYELPPRGEVFVREASIILASSVMELPPAADGKTSAVFDAGKIRFPLVIRARKQGDFFIPAGFGKKTKIQDFFVNNKIPRDERDVVPLVCSGDNVMWIYGYRIDQRFLPDNHTREYLVIASRSAKK
jgi:tRNA(Ile)-lysidine synthase